MSLDIVGVEARPGFQLDLEYENGELRRFDMSLYLHYPVFRRLENPAFFSLAHLDHGTVVWPGDIDIAPETLYDLSVTKEPQSKGPGSN